ncbi:polysaccharide biosynthesis protein [Nocardia transvalensis]|uniref:polysaccharide biosynthesis protein n=1 Tax=Nocardia transvalensis TaxID=37333 RepID=UPI0018946446|nr:polysaccharide biosynthesis protein [Nocardia transvalensis]MBF6328979.1 polysaccharide biosynthesis protein [Nocardia transvalensis]
MTANVAGYLLQLLAGRWLGVAGYSEFASLLAVQLLCAVPALALQNVVAREVVRGAPVAAARALGLRCAAVVAVVAAVLVPVVAMVLHVSVAAAAGALVAAPVLVVLSQEQGLLQGAHRFRALATVLGGAGIARVTPALITLALGAGAAPALWSAALGLTLTALTAHHLTPPTPFAGRRTASTPEADNETAAPFIASRTPSDASQGVRENEKGAAAERGGIGAVLRAAQVQAALMALSSADLIVARIVLGDVDASRYALGAIATKIAFWLPQAVGVVLYPRMAQPRYSARAVRDALAVLSAVGIVAVVGAAVLAPLAPLLAGRDYAPIEGLLWLFALDGALLALLQGALLSAIAVDRTAPAIVIWVGLAIEIVVMLVFVRSLPVLITTATAVTAAVTVAIIAVALAAVRRVGPEK